MLPSPDINYEENKERVKVMQHAALQYIASAGDIIVLVNSQLKQINKA
jgi:hypothetical protein